MTTDRRLIIASNRLPFVVQTEHGELKLELTCGGLAAALGAVHDRGTNIWIGWPGDRDAPTATERTRLTRALRQKRVIPVSLTAADIAGYYDGVCNSVLWPVLHCLIDRLPITPPGFQTYRAVNQRFADAIVGEYRDGDVIWIHDYHLLLAPTLIRLRLPHAPIGFFLHTPFPPADIFRVLPWRRELLDGVLGSTVIGFQTDRDAHNFQDTVSMLAGYHTAADAVITDGREVRFGAYPIGLDPMRLPATDRATARDDAGNPELAMSGRRLLLGVDRLDYTKGIPRRLTAFRILLERNPELRGRVELMQVAVPSRSHVPSYGAFRRDVDALVASINAAYGTADWTPVRHIQRAVSPRDLSRLYMSADVMLVTSLRDGMNLVAKEFVLARSDEDGVLVLSEFAGAAEELSEAVPINPYAVDELADAIADALAFDREERRRRMRALRQSVARGTVHTWAERFIRDLVRTSAPVVSGDDQVLQRVVRSASDRGGDVLLIVRYEGVLVQACKSSEPFRPDPEMLELLRMLQTRSGIAVHLISSLDQSILDQWLDLAPAVIWAEQGLWRREADGHRWKRTQWISTSWVDDVRELLHQFALRTPGALVDECGNYLSWDFTRAERIQARTQAQLLAALLTQASNTLGFIVRITDGEVQVGPAGLTGGRAFSMMREAASSPCLAVFDTAESISQIRKSLNPGDIAVAVGGTHTFADGTLEDGRDLRKLLWNLVDSLPARATTATVPAGWLRTRMCQSAAVSPVGTR
jgi:trehalose 6-phosphate synthase/phosphatase